jgi:hypothetical protein
LIKVSRKCSKVLLLHFVVKKRKIRNSPGEIFQRKLAEYAVLAYCSSATMQMDIMVNSTITIFEIHVWQSNCKKKGAP